MMTPLTKTDRYYNLMRRLGKGVSWLTNNHGFNRHKFKGANYYWLHPVVTLENITGIAQRKGIW